MIKKEIKAVQEFHEAFGLDIRQQPTVALDKKVIELRYKLMQEENE